MQPMIGINFDNTKIEDINDKIAKAQHGEHLIVYIKENMYIHAQTIAKSKHVQTSDYKRTNIQEFFKIKSNQHIFTDIENQGYKIQIIMSKSDVSTDGDYTGIYIPQQLLVLFVQWLDKTKYQEYQQILNIVIQNGTLKGQTTNQQIIEDQQIQLQKTISELQKKHQLELKQKEREHEDHIEKLSSQYIYSLINPSLPGVVKHGWTRSDECIQRLKGINTDKDYMIINGQELKTDWVVKHYVKVIHGNEAEDILFNMKIQKRAYKNRELFFYTDEKELLNDLEIARDYDKNCNYQFVKSRPASPLQRCISVKKQQEIIIDELQQKTFKELTEYCKVNKVPNYTNFGKKEDLIKQIKNFQNEQLPEKQKTKKELICEAKTQGIKCSNRKNLDRMNYLNSQEYKDFINLPQEQQFAIFFKEICFYDNKPEEYIQSAEISTAFRMYASIASFSMDTAIEYIRKIDPTIKIVMDDHGKDIRIRRAVYGVKVNQELMKKFK